MINWLVIFRDVVFFSDFQWFYEFSFFQLSGLLELFDIPKLLKGFGVLIKQTISFRIYVRVFRLAFSSLSNRLIQLVQDGKFARMPY